MFKRDATAHARVFGDMLRGIIRPTPRFVPKFVWRFLINFFIKLD